MSRTRLAKLVAPRWRQIVRRPRVLRAIARALRSGVCWLAAPPGYGKTTAIADYLHSRSRPHIWYRVDAGDQDVAGFFHYMARSLGRAGAARRLPVFGPEYADQLEEFARRFFRAYFAALPRPVLLVLDDLHAADVPPFRTVLAILLCELPQQVACACVSRTLPPSEVGELALKGQLSVVDQSILRFSQTEARALVARRLDRASRAIDLSGAQGWAAGLVLLAERASAVSLRAEVPSAAQAEERRAAVFAELARHLFDGLGAAEQDALLKLSLLAEITPELAGELTGSESAPALLQRLHQRQLMVTRGDEARPVYRLHDLLRDFLADRLVRHASPPELARLRERAAELLDRSGDQERAIELALLGGAWPLARRLIAARAAALLAQGRRATLIEWCARLPAGELADPWLCYWLGVAHMPDDDAAETWLDRAWMRFREFDERAGQCLAAARATIAKTDSWRTHSGLAKWTQRALEFVDRGLADLDGDDELLACSGVLRAVDFAEDLRASRDSLGLLTGRLADRLSRRRPGDTTSLRLIASNTLVEHAGSAGNADLFERAVDSVVADLHDRDASPWALGLWLVGFGSVCGRYFAYAKRGLPYASAEEALRAAIAIGEREALRGVEFGALYHLQLLMKLRGDFSEFGALVGRIAEIADSRNSTQVAVLADCQAALHTVQGRLDEAYRACDRFTAAIEAADEPPIERWPHHITTFQVMIADRRAEEAAEFMDRLVPLYESGVQRRTSICAEIARTLRARWSGDPDYVSRLRACVEGLREAQWPAVLLNLPGLLAELYGDALAHDIEPDFCRAQIARRGLAPPAGRPASWPWALRVHVLGNFRLERDGEPVKTKGRAPTRSLDIVRFLALARHHTCSLEHLCEVLWPDLDGSKARAACEQSLHRLRKLLGAPDLVTQREGKLRLAPDRVWVDLDDWESLLGRVLEPGAPRAPATGEMERAFWSFPGPLLHSDSGAAWSFAAAERVRGKFVELASRMARHHESAGQFSRARTFWLRALDFYPSSERCYEGLLRARLGEGDASGALDDFRRYERMLRREDGASPSRAIRALMAPIVGATRYGA